MLKYKMKLFSVLHLFLELIKPLFNEQETEKRVEGENKKRREYIMSNIFYKLIKIYNFSPGEEQRGGGGDNKIS